MKKSIREKIIEFNKARGWTPSPADCAKSIMIEGAELLEHYQWDSSKLDTLPNKEKNKLEIQNEAADVFWYLITFCNAEGIDLENAVEAKLAHNEKKYPAEMFTHDSERNKRNYRNQKMKYRQKQ